MVHIDELLKGYTLYTFVTSHNAYGVDLGVLKQIFMTQRRIYHDTVEKRSVLYIWLKRKKLFTLVNEEKNKIPFFVGKPYEVFIGYIKRLISAVFDKVVEFDE